MVTSLSLHHESVNFLIENTQQHQQAFAVKAYLEQQSEVKFFEHHRVGNFVSVSFTLTLYHYTSPIATTTLNLK